MKYLALLLVCVWCVILIAPSSRALFFVSNSSSSLATPTPSSTATSTSTPPPGVPPIPTLAAVSTPTGTVTVLNNSMCGAGLPTQHAGFQAALTAAAGGTLWIPAGCQVNLNEENDISSNTILACPGDGVAGLHNMTGIMCSGAPNILQGHGVINVTVEGCAMTGTYVNNATNAAAGRAYQRANGCKDFLFNGGGTVEFFNGSNITITNNLEKGTYADEGFFFDGTQGCTMSKNVFVDNYQNGVQLSNSKNCNLTNNYARDTGWDLEDSGVQPPGTSTGTWSGNTYTCVNGEGNLSNGSVYNNWGPCSGILCTWAAGVGCSASGCSQNQYNGNTFSGNTVNGSSAAITDSASIGGVTFSNNSFVNGGQYCKGG